MFKKLFIIQFFITIAKSYNICIIGGSSGIGKEIIFQGLEKNEKILALTNNPNNINIPYREGGLSEKSTCIPIISENLKIDCYDNIDKYNFDNLVFTTGAGPFENDYSDIITKNILNKNITTLKNIILLSAYGVADSLPNSNYGIKIMNSWYLKDTYRAKNEQEKIIKKYSKKYKKNILILRPKALSYGINIYGIQSRKKCAEQILNYINDN